MEQCLIIVGRSKSTTTFTEEFVEPLVTELEGDEFLIESIESLGDLSDLDGMSRFIAFVLLDPSTKKGMKIESLFSILINLQMGVRLFENISDAKAYAEEHYSYGNKLVEEIDEREYEEEYDEDEDDDDGPNWTAEDIEDFMTFEALFRTGKLSIIRGMVYGEPATVMAQIINGPDQIRVTPYALMVSSEILENMELPKIDERN